MARVMEPTAKQIRGWKRWVASRPPAIRAVAERFEPWSLYRLKTTGQRVVVASFFENGTVSVNVLPQFNLTLFGCNVFGINPDDLEPCELPGPGDPVGAVFGPAEAHENIDALRVMIRPDLFVMGADGKAMRKN